MGYINFNRKGFSAWLGDKNKPKGNFTRANIQALREIKGLNVDFAINNAVLYFTLTELGVEGVRQMLRSGTKQRNFLHRVSMTLKDYGLTADYCKGAAADIRQWHERVDWVRAVIKENLRLTEYYPFFADVGFDRLYDFGCPSMEMDDLLAKIKTEFEEWRIPNEAVIETHLRTVAGEKQRIEERRQRMIEEAKLEKELARQKKREENAEIKEIKKNEKAYKAKQRRIEREFSRYYEGKA